MKEDIYALSNIEIALMLGKRLRDYRKRMRFTRKVLAERSGVSEFTIGGFERGENPGLALQSLLALMRALGQLERIEALFPEISESPKEVFEQERRKLKR
ncbi:MAG: helix-turn-helix domain-containing protein [Alistipes sp.]|uniref:helix-turn-helix domain-containing protein n=1 Tax=Alistipes sp. TaxID=1872444 RepID=UPI0025C1856A|nr:helix-turn-helix transcriptional regulator [Alistipes sp.]MCD7795700.1 helix-turn-helix domain-containing protein [Alistipes sp.]MCD8274419.1 helix-turn-helix domain-containing protein [Alistipes sp.]